MQRGDYSHPRRQIPEKTLANRIKSAHGRLMPSQSSRSGAFFGMRLGMTTRSRRPMSDEPLDLERQGVLENELMSIPATSHDS
jgi:hypothetical protein